MLLKVKGPNWASRSYRPLKPHLSPYCSPSIPNSILSALATVMPWLLLWQLSSLQPQGLCTLPVPSTGKAPPPSLYTNLLSQVSAETAKWDESPLHTFPLMGLYPFYHCITTRHSIYSSISVSSIPNKNREPLFVQCYYLGAHKRMVLNTYLLKRWGRGGWGADEKRYFQNQNFQLWPFHSQLLNKPKCLHINRKNDKKQTKPYFTPCIIINRKWTET